jgi:hypothetical protein
MKWFDISQNQNHVIIGEQIDGCIRYCAGTREYHGSNGILLAGPTDQIFDDVASAVVLRNRHTAFLTFENAKLLLSLKIFDSVIQSYFGNIAERRAPDEHCRSRSSQITRRN